MQNVSVNPLFKTDLYLNYEGDDFRNGIWYFRDREETGRKFNVVIVDGGILTTRAMNRVKSYNHNRDKQGYDDLDIVNKSWEQCVMGKEFSDFDVIDITARMEDGIVYNLKLYVFMIHENHFHFEVELL